MKTKPDTTPKKRGFIRRTVISFADVPTWMGYQQLADTTRSVFEVIKDLFTFRKPTITETFDEAKVRLNLSEEDIKRRIRNLTFLAIFWFIASIGMIFYGVYLAGNRSIHGFLACLGLSIVMFSQAFYYHFWMFQMKQRRLGCTFKEWWNANFTGGGA